MNTVAIRVKRALFGLGHYRRRLERMAFPGVTVLCYHGLRDDAWPLGTMQFEPLHVRASLFREHCRLLRDTCHPVSHAQIRSAFRGETQLPTRPVLVTFDDGYRSVLTLALPILKEFQIPAVVFACSLPLAERRRFWFDACAEREGGAEVERIKSKPMADWAAFERAWAMPVAPDDPHAPLSPGELVELAAAPEIEIGAHTASHPILSRLSAAEQEREIAGNKASLEAWLNRPVSAFAYPNGRPGIDYTDASTAILRSYGFDLGFTTRSGYARRDDPPLELPRFFMLDSVTPSELAHRLAVSWPAARGSA